MKTKLEKDVEKLLNSNNPSWKIIATLANEYEKKGMKPIANKLNKIAQWLHEA